jgi:Metallopeptidase family M24
LLNGDRTLGFRQKETPVTVLNPPVHLTDLTLPEFGEPTVEPVLPAAIFGLRRAEAMARARKRGLDALVVYGDREHSPNLAFLCNFDPRFEEGALILHSGHSPALLVGNEGWGYAELMASDVERVLFQSFSLLAQPRGQSATLTQILTDRGIGPGAKVGVIGWKYFGEGDGDLDHTSLEVPSYIADALRRLVGSTGSVVNATDILMAADDGMRAINDVDQLASFEYAATYTSQGLRNVMFNLKPGMREIDAMRMMNFNGLPLSAHPMLSSGPRAAYGLPSPSTKVIARGDPFTMCYSAWGSLTSRAGFVAVDERDLPVGVQDYVARLVAPYFSAAVAWYETIGIGVSGAAMYDAVHSRIGGPFFGVKLNPGHLIHLDEWMNSPIFENSTIPLRSGMALQIDIIPATNSPWFMSNIEDTLALADTDLRASFAARYPEAWARIEQRRRFMIDVLGIKLRPEVLPFSNIPAYLPPFLLSPGRAMAVVQG